MLLSELKTGERAIVVKVLGHGGFRKRIIEMGFIKGKTVEAVLNAPLQDPVKYKIMGYELSLRHDEAAMIQVVSEEEIAREYGQDASLSIPSNGGEVVEVEAISNHLREVATRKRRTINVALVGNPNSGKTSLFNFASGATEHVGNYSGVTVDAKEGKCQFEGYTFNIVDLPGTYSLTAYSPEELYVRKQIIEKTPDVIINVVDASNLERNLYLTTQLIDMDLRMVCALNMYDDLERKGDKLDTAKLGQLLGVPMIPTVFKTGKGVDLLFHIIINLYEGVDYIDENGNINPEVAQEIQNWHKEYGKEEIEHEEDFASGGKVKNNVFRHIHINGQAQGFLAVFFVCDDHVGILRHLRHHGLCFHTVLPQVLAEIQVAGHGDVSLLRLFHGRKGNLRRTFRDGRGDTGDVEPVYVGEYIVPVKIGHLRTCHRGSGTVVNDLAGTLVGTGLQIVDAKTSFFPDDPVGAHAETAQFRKALFTQCMFRKDGDIFHRHMEIRQGYGHIGFASAKCRFKHRALHKSFIVSCFQAEHDLAHCQYFHGCLLFRISPSYFLASAMISTASRLRVSIFENS